MLTTPNDRFVSVNSLRVHYLDWGRVGAPPLVLLHRINGTAHSFDEIALMLSQEFHVMAIDLPGHGETSWDPRGAYLVEDSVRVLESFIDSIGLDRLVLLGNSTGGRIAQVYAGLHPGRMEALVVEDVGPERPAAIAAAFARRSAEDANGWVSEEALLEVLIRRAPRMAAALHRSHVHFGTKRTEGGRVVWKRDPAVVKGFISTDLWQYVERIECRTLYLLGGASNTVSAETQWRLRQTLPQCEIVVLPGVGHYPHLEEPARYVEIVRHFLLS